MTARVLIIDEQGVYRRLFAHHVATGFDSPNIAEYDPAALGKLPADFSGSSYDAVLLGDAPGEADGLAWLRDLSRRNGFPPVIFLMSDAGVRGGRDGGRCACLPVESEDRPREADCGAAGRAVPAGPVDAAGAARR
jgi:hypothetical protein